MDVNANFTDRVVLNTEAIAWEDSPMPGVQRRRLDRIDTGDDTERVTTIVRFAPKSTFSAHTHSGGEEFIVLDGVFEDDYGAWPAGSYVRNPPQSRHKPGSTLGCTLFVKLCQFHPEDRTFIHANVHKLGAVPVRHRDGVNASPLYKDKHEDVRLERWDPGAEVTLDAPGGAEILILEGDCTAGTDTLPKYAWMRLPVGSREHATAGPNGTLIWIKTGHLRGL